jgi:hypothetical protein
VCLIITTVLRELMVSMWLKKRHEMLHSCHRPRGIDR